MRLEHVNTQIHLHDYCQVSIEIFPYIEFAYLAWSNLKGHNLELKNSTTVIPLRNGLLFATCVPSDM